MFKMRTCIVLAVSLFLVVGLGWGQQLTIIWPDIEQGACTLIVGPDGTGVLIDSGTLLGRTPDEPVVPWLLSFKEVNPDFRLQYIIATHYHQDHICWIADVINEGLLDPGAVVYDRGGSYRKDFYTPYATSIEAAGIPRRMVTVGQTITLGDEATLRCLAAPDALIDNDDSNTESSLSLGFLLSYRGFQLWIGGDMGEREEHAVGTPAVGTPIGDVDVYVVHHHGSDGSSSSDFLSTIKAEVAICQVGANPPSYNHPRLSTIERVLAAPDTNGDITDGTPLLILQNRGYYTSTLDRVYIADPDTDTGALPGTITLVTDGLSYSIKALGLPQEISLSTDGSRRPPLPHSVSTPPAPEGPRTGQTGQTLTFTASILACSQGHPVAYRFDWGDGSYSAWSSFSGQPKSYQRAGAFQVRYQARCSVETSIVSEWSQALIVTIGAPIAKLLINEVEANPKGSDSGAEWVELYNPTTVSIDLSGWKISVTYLSHPTGWERLPAVTIAPGGYYVYTYPKQYLEDAGGRPIRLMDPQGRVVDEVPEGVVIDKKDDSYTWQRIPNGVDTDIAQDWRFRKGTPGKANQ